MSFEWFTKYSVSCDWACHRDRGSRGGEDRRHPAGSPVLAPYDAIVTYGMYDDGASYVQFKYANGYAHQAVHVQETAWRVPHGARVAADTLCAASDGRKGTFGAGTSTGQHVHFQGHRPDGTRIPWADVPAPTTQLAGITHRPPAASTLVATDGTTLEETMEFIISHQSDDPHRNGLWLRRTGGIVQLTPEMHEFGTVDYWALSDGRKLLDIPVFDTRGNERAFDLLKEMYG